MSIRIAEYPILDVIINRWSARAMSGEAITEQEMLPLFEAARWAPSSYNNQPWHFVYSYKTDESWKNFLDLLIPFNQEWAHNAGCLIIVASNTLFEKTGKPSITHLFDTGAACQNLALQGIYNGLVVHPIEGFDYQKAHTVAQLPSTYTVIAMIVVGKPGNIEVLTPELQLREVKTERKHCTEFIHHNTFNKTK